MRLLCLVAFALVACGGPPPVGERPPVPVVLYEIGGAEALSVFEYSGEVDAKQRVELAFEVPGRVVEIPVKEGQRVERGDVVARLDARDFQAQVTAARARLEVAELQYGRAEESFVAAAVSKRDLDVARRERDVAAAERGLASKALEDATLRAPFAGVVSRRLVEVFEGVQPKQPVVFIEDADALEVVVQVPESDFAAMHPGLTLAERTARVHPVVTFSVLPGRELEAWIEEYSTSADPVSRTFSATFAFERPADDAVLPGMTARVRLSVPADAMDASGVLVPSAAAINDYGPDPVVFVADPATSTVTRTPVQLGLLVGDQIQVKTGLARGQVVVVRGAHTLRDGTRIAPLEPTDEEHGP